jgi:2',3'-cyclic-nucleotide 2'-phosphodiesterase (5'-nucleotidase family)
MCYKFIKYIIFLFLCFNNNICFAIESNNEVSQLNFWYINDTHGELIKYGKIVTALNKILKSDNTIISASGDMYIKNIKINNAMTKLMNIANVDILALGNHEFDNGSSSLAKQLNKAKFKTIVSNMEIPQTNPLNKLKEEDKLFSTYIIEKNGQKYGIIGAAPIDVDLGLFDKKDKVNVLPPKETIEALNKEVEELEKQGINKIILISHLGYFNEGGDLNIAKNTAGIDIILGGHTHLEINGVQTKDKDKTHLTNLVQSKRNEPVIIVQTSGMANKLGSLSVEFNQNGVLLTDSNHISNTQLDLSNYENEDKEVNVIIRKALGKDKIVGTVITPFESSGSYEERNTENPTANFVTDAAYEVAKNKHIDVAMLHSPTVRGGLNRDLTVYQIKYSMLPFNTPMYYVELSEDNFVKLLNTEALTSITTDNSQLIQCRGMRYIIDKTIPNPNNINANCIKAIVLLDKNNFPIREINPMEPNSSNTIKCVVSGYLFMDNRTKPILQNAKNVKCIGKEQDIVFKYLKKHKKIDAVREGRITVITEKERANKL